MLPVILIPKNRLMKIVLITTSQQEFKPRFPMLWRAKLIIRTLYVHDWPLQPFSQDYGLASHTTRIVCVLYMSGGTHNLTSTPNDRFLRKFFIAGFIYSQSFCQKSAEMKSPTKYFFIHISF